MTTTTTLSTSLSNVSKHANVHFQEDETGQEAVDIGQQRMVEQNSVHVMTS